VIMGAVLTAAKAPTSARHLLRVAAGPRESSA